MIEVKALSKTFSIPKRKKSGKVGEDIDPRESGKTFNALAGISFVSKSGEILGLLGPNGAGKTTLLRILSTALQPSSGTCVVHGADIVRDPLEVRRKIGFLSGNTGLYGRLSAREILEYFGKLHQVPKDKLSRRIEELFQVLEISSFAHRRTDTLSAGMKQKVNIARTLVHDPEVIVFDEPTTGLDVHAAQTILAFIERFKQSGKSVIFSTHHMHEVERLCDRVVLIHQGQLRFEGSVAQMKSQAQRTHLDEAFLTLIGQEVKHVAL